MATITAAAHRYSGLSVWPESVRTERKYTRHVHAPTPAAPAPAPEGAGVIAVMIRSEPRRHQGHVARARSNTRPRSLAQLHCGEEPRWLFGEAAIST